MTSRVLFAVSVFLLGSFLLYMGKPGGALFLLVSPVLVLPLIRWLASLVRMATSSRARGADASDDRVGASFGREAPVLHPESVDRRQRIFGAGDE